MVRLLAPAKVNWHLRVLGRRPDGYHDLDTLFARLNLCDRITLIPRPSGIRIRTSARIPKGPANLAYQAAALVHEAASLRSSAKRSVGGVEIRIDKKIPVAAGLGGGSSDAAAVLMGLNRLWRLGWTRAKIARLGARIGSDVPFFVWQTPFARGRGRGEKITPIASRRRFWHVVVKPPFGISTREAYGEYARRTASDPASLTPPRGGVKILVRSLEGTRNTFPDRLFNSLEAVLNKRLTKIFEIKKALMQNGARAALLSGSGSAVFGVFENEIQARRAARTLRKKRLGRVFVARTF